MKKFFPLIALFCLFFLGHCATEHEQIQTTDIFHEKFDVPLWNVGDYWIYQNDDKTHWGYQIKGMEDSLYIVEPSSGIYMYRFDTKTLELKTYIVSKGKKIRSESGPGNFFDFPLHVGKKWSKMVQGKAEHSMAFDYLLTFKVISFENIIVRAGTFKAFKIERQQTVIGPGDSVITYIYYSPEVKNIVKFQFHTSYGHWFLSGQNYELLKFKLKEDASPQ